MKKVWLLIVMGLMCSSEFLGPQVVAAQEPPSADIPTKEPRKTEAYFAPYLLGTFPIDKNLSIGGNGFSNETFRGTNIQGSGGAGLKAGVYPGAMGGVLGLEGEFFGHGGKLKTSGGAFANGEGTQCFVGVGAGAGASLAHLRDINFQTNSGALTGKAGDVAFAYQFLAGMRAYVNKKVYVFGEYKYFGSAYDWKSESSSGVSGPTTSLTFRTHIVALGLGVTF